MWFRSRVAENIRSRQVAQAALLQIAIMAGDVKRAVVLKQYAPAGNLSLDECRQLSEAVLNLPVSSQEEKKKTARACADLLFPWYTTTGSYIDVAGWTAIKLDPSLIETVALAPCGYNLRSTLTGLMLEEGIGDSYTIFQALRQLWGHSPNDRNYARSLVEYALAKKNANTLYRVVLLAGKELFSSNEERKEFLGHALPLFNPGDESEMTQLNEMGRILLAP
jgi:hypothetical protein